MKVNSQSQFLYYLKKLLLKDMLIYIIMKQTTMDRHFNNQTLLNESNERLIQHLKDQIVIKDKKYDSLKINYERVYTQRNDLKNENDYLTRKLTEYRGIIMNYINRIFLGNQSIREFMSDNYLREEQEPLVDNGVDPFPI